MQTWGATSRCGEPPCGRSPPVDPALGLGPFRGFFCYFCYCSRIASTCGADNPDFASFICAPAAFVQPTAESLNEVPDKCVCLPYVFGTLCSYMCIWLHCRRRHLVRWDIYMLMSCHMYRSRQGCRPAAAQTGVLGEGTFGVVVRACDPTTSGVEIAIKLLPRGETSSSPRLAPWTQEMHLPHRSPLHPRVLMVLQS